MKSLVVLALVAVVAAPVATAADDLEYLASALWADPSDVAIEGTRACVAYPNGLAVFDVTNPDAPALLGRIDLFGTGQAVTMAGDYAYLAEGLDGLRIVDISDPANLREVGWCDTPGDAVDIVYGDGYIYIADSFWNGLEVIDVRDPAAPHIAGSLDTQGAACALFVKGAYVFLADADYGVAVINVSQPESPYLATQWPAHYGFIQDIDIVGDIAYCVWVIGEKDRYDPSGLEIYDVDNPLDPHFLSIYNNPEGTGAVHVQKHFAYLPNRDGHVNVIDVGDPRTPTWIGDVSTPGSSYELALGSGIACVADGSSGFCVLDTSVPSQPRVRGRYWEASWLTEVAARGNLAYLCDESFGLHVLDLADPLNPTLAGRLPLSYGPHAAALASSTLYLGCRNAGLVVADLTDPTQPVEMARLVTPADDVALQGNYIYAISDSAGLRVIDVSDPAAPAVVGSCQLPLWAYWVSVCGDFAYVGNGYSGLRIIDVSDPAHPVARGYVDPREWVYRVFAAWPYVYAILDRNSVVIYDVSNPDGPREMSHIATGGFVSDLRLSGDRLIAAADPGVVVLDVSDPMNPVIESACRLPSGAGELDLEGDLVFMVGYGSFMVAGGVTQSAGDELHQFAGDLRMSVPSPVRAGGVIHLDAGRPQPVRLALYDVAGRLRAQLYEGYAPGNVSVDRNTSDLPAGIYFLRLESESDQICARVAIVR